MMIEARHTTTGRWLSDFCSGRYMERYFREINIHGSPEGTDGYPLLILANHFSWWDGFIQYRLNKRVFGRKLYVMMIEQQLRKHKIMNRCGCFSIRKNSRSMIETMDYTRSLLSEAGKAVLIFPQGEITSMHDENIRFDSGAEYLLKRLTNEVRIIFNVNLTDYGSYKKPSLDIYYQVADAAELKHPGQLGAAYARFYRECIERQISKI